MTDIKISELTPVTTLAETDIVPVVQDPSGTPVTRRITVKSILDARLNFSLVSADRSLSAASGVQSVFGSAGDVFTLPANTTYEFEGAYYITKSGTTCTTALALALGGGASIHFIGYQALAQNVAANTTGATHGSAWITQVASTVVNVTASGELYVTFKGIIRMNAGGTVTPQLNFSAAPTSPVLKAGSYIKFTPIGTTNDVAGAAA